MRAKLIPLAAALTLALAACDPTTDLEDPPVALGEFRLGHNIVVARDPQLIPGTRKATEAEWQAAMTKAIDDRFGRYDGARLYHLGISIDAYNLAPIDVPGIPTPKSALAITASVWDDALGRKLNDQAKQLTVLSGLLSGTGVQPTKEVQMANLSASAARAVQNWLLENPEWFETPPAAETPAN